MQRNKSKLNKTECHFICKSIQFYGEIFSRHGMKPDPMLSLDKDAIFQLLKSNCKHSFAIINYVSKFTPSTAEPCKLVRHLKSVNVEWISNVSYQSPFNKGKLITKEDAYMKFYDEMKPLYMETDTSEVELKGTILQTRMGTSCPRDETPHKNILRLTHS